MQYETILLELLTRIKKLEEEVAQLQQNQEQSHTQLIEENENNNEIVQYKKMTNEMIDKCYKSGKMISKGENVQELADSIVEETGMNRNSAIMYLYAVNGMLEGTIFKRAISAKAMQIYFDKIFNELGSSGLKKAIHATKLHINYRKECGLTVDAIEEVCRKAESKI